MTREPFLFALILAVLPAGAVAQDSTKVATHSRAADVLTTIEAAPEGRVSDQQIRHIDAGEGYLGAGIVQRPAESRGHRLSSASNTTSSPRSIGWCPALAHS